MSKSSQNIVPGVTYHRAFLSDPCAALSDVMEQCEFAQRTARMYGREYQVPRLEAWYGAHSYTFNGHSFSARPLPPVLQSIKIALECFVPVANFDGCLVNVYRDGSDSVSWHADDETDMGPDPIVASISLGATRAFHFRAVNEQPTLSSALIPNRAKVSLEAGSLLLMGRGVQAMYQHALPKCANAGLRVNLTFRSK